MNTIVEHINSAGFSFVEFALPMLIQSGVLIVVLLLADLFLRKKVKAVFRYWIWMLVLVKLVLPTSLSSPLSLGYLFGEKLTYQDLAETALALESAEPAPAETLPGMSPIYIQPNPYVPPKVPVISGVEPVVAEPVGPPTVPVTPLSWQGIVFLVWLAVVMAMGLLLLQRALFVRGLVAQAKKVGRLMNDELEYCCTRMKIKRKVGLKVSPNATTPSVCGLIRPVILVPWNLASTLGASRLRTVLMHELAHIKRGDLWVNLAQTVLQIIYFYNPLLWIANCVIRRIREQAVDEAVLVAMGEKAQRYPQMLVDVAKMAFKRPALSLRLIGVVESKSALAGRIKHMLGRPMPKSARLGIIGVLAVIIAGAILLPMAAGKDEEGASEDMAKASEFMASLPNGVTVELVGICEHPSEGKQWWKPDGTLWEDRPYEEFSSYNTMSGEKGYELVCRLSSDEDVVYEVESADQGGSAGRAVLHSERGLRPAFRNGEFYGVIFFFSPGLSQAAIGIGVGLDRNWKTIASLEGDVSKASSSINNVVLYPAVGADGRTYIDAAYSFPEGKGQAYRLVAVDKSNKQHIMQRGSETKGRGSIHCRKQIDLPLKQIKTIHFQTQPLQRVAFENVSLRPGMKTDVKVAYSTTVTRRIRQAGKPESGRDETYEFLTEPNRKTRLLTPKEWREMDNWVSIVASVVKDSGRYLLPEDEELTLSELIRAAGYDPQKVPVSFLEIMRPVKLGQVRAYSIFSRNLETLFSKKESDPVLKRHDSIVGGWIYPSPNQKEFLAQYSFGEVVELIIDDDNSENNMFVDLDAGKLVTPANDLDNRDEEAVTEWMKNKGVDALGEIAPDVRGLVGFDMVALSVDNHYWGLGADAVVARLAIKNFDLPILMRAEADLPATYLIKTREYGLGVLQIIGFSDKPKGVKIRYKMVQKKSAKKTDVQISAGGLVAKIIESERKIEDIQLHMTCTIPARKLVFYEFDWGYDGGKEFYTGYRNSTEPGSDKISRTTQITKAFDGQKEWRLRVSSKDKQPRGGISESDFSTFRAMMTFNTLLGFDAKEGSSLSFGEAIAQAESVSVRDKVEFIDGHPCYVIEAVNIETDPSVNWAYDVRAWIDYQRDYRLLKFEKCRSISGRNRFKVVSRRVDNIRLKQVDGIWLPVEGRRTTFYTNDYGPPGGMSLARFASLSTEEQERVGVFKLKPMLPPRRLEVDADSIRLNKGIPPQRFTIAFPEGCEVYDGFTGNRYVVGEPSEREAALSDADWIERMSELSVSELIDILRNSSVGKDKKKWFAAVHRLVEIGSAAVPELVAELRQTEKPQTQSKLALTLRAIGDPSAVPGLIDGLGRSGFSSDYGMGQARTELDMFFRQHQLDPSKKSLGLARPVREITITLEKLTGHTEGHDHFHAYDLKYDRLGSYTVTPEIRDRQRQHRRRVAQRWRKWWQANKDDIKPAETPPKPPDESRPARSKKLEEMILAAPEGSILTLAVVPNVGSPGRRPSLTKEQYQRYVDDLTKNGPIAGSVRGDSFQWSPVKGDPTRFKDLPLSTYKERTYLLLCARAQYVMMPELEGRLAWGLEKVQAGRDANGKPMISIEFDEKGSGLFYELTKANIGNHLAMGVDGWVLSAPAIETSVRKHAVIAGDFTEQQMRTFVEDLRKGMTPVDEQTAKEMQLIAEAAGNLNKQDVVKMDPRQVVESFLLAGLAGLSEKLAWFVRPGSAVAEIMDTMDLSEELLDGHKIKVVNVYAGSRDAFAVTSDVTDQYGEQLGQFMFYLSNEGGNWLIYDMDAGEADRVRQNLTDFLSKHPDVQVEGEKTSRTEFTAILPNGMAVELVGLCKEPVDGAKWWKPDGGNMTEPFFRASKRTPPLKGMTTRYTFLAKAQGSENISIKMKIYEGFGWSTRVAEDGTALCYVKHPNDAKPHHEDAFSHGPIEVGVAQGQWIKGRGESSPNIQTPTSYSIGSRDEIVIQPPRPEKNSPETATIFWFTSSSHDYEYRLICTLKDGSVEECTKPFFQSTNKIEAGNLKNSTLETKSFSIDRPLEQIVNYELLYRKFDYARFNNVAFKPNAKTGVQVEGESKISELLTVLEEGRYADIRRKIILMVDEIGDKEPISFLYEQLKSKDRERRSNAALALQLLGETPCVEGLCHNVELIKNELAFGQGPELVFSLTNTTAEPIDVIGFQSNSRSGRYLLPCAQLTISQVGSKYYGVSSYDIGTKPKAIRIAPGKSWSFRIPSPKIQETTTTEARRSSLPSLSALPPGRYTARLTYFTRESEIEKFGPGLVYAAEMGPLAGKKPDRLWRGIIMSKERVFEVLDDDSEQLRIRKAIDSGEGLENVEFELKASKAKALLSVSAKNTGEETLYLGGHYSLRGKGMGNTSLFGSGPMELKPGATLELGGWNLRTIGPGTYWVEYLSNFQPERVLKKSNTVTFEVPKPAAPVEIYDGKEVPADRLIIPGRGVGSFTFGMSKDDVLKSLGKTKGGSLRVAGNSFSVDGVILNIIDDSLKSIDVLSPLYRFANGLGIGSSEQQIIQAFGNDFHLKEYEGKDFLTYEDKGLVFEIFKYKRTVMEMSVLKTADPLNPSRKTDVQAEAQGGWGEAVEGVQVRLRADKDTWGAEEKPIFKADIRNRGVLELSFFAADEFCQLEIDGEWHGWTGPWGKLNVERSLLGPGSQINDISISLAKKWVGRRKELALTTGVHTVRVAFVLQRSERDYQNIVRAISNPIEIKILPTKTTVQVEDIKERIARGPEQVRAIDKILREWFGACVAGDVESMKNAYSPGYQLVERDMRQISELLGMNPGWRFSLLSAMWDKENAMVVSGMLEHGDSKVDGPMVLVWTFNISEGKWGIIDIDLEEIEGLQLEYSRFLKEHPNAHLWFDNPEFSLQTLSLAGAPRTTKLADLSDLFEARPPGSKSYHIREGVDVVYSGLDGTVYYIPKKKIFYVQHDKLGSSTRTYYGPFKGDPYRLLRFQGGGEVESVLVDEIEAAGAGISLPVKKIYSGKIENGGSFEWETSIEPRIRFRHGWYTIEDGMVREHVGAGASRNPEQGRLNLKLNVEVKDNMLNLKVQRVKDLVDGSGTASVASKTPVPAGAYLRHDSSIDSAVLTNKHLTLWRGDFIRDGNVVKSVIYAAYLTTPDDPDWFKPPVSQKDEIVTAKDKSDVPVEVGEAGKLEEGASSAPDYSGLKEAIETAHKARSELLLNSKGTADIVFETEEYSITSLEPSGSAADSATWTTKWYKRGDTNRYDIYVPTDSRSRRLPKPQDIRTAQDPNKRIYYDAKQGKAFIDRPVRKFGNPFGLSKRFDITWLYQFDGRELPEVLAAWEKVGIEPQITEDRVDQIPCLKLKYDQLYVSRLGNERKRRVELWVAPEMAYSLIRAEFLSQHGDKLALVEGYKAAYEESDEFEGVWLLKEVTIISNQSNFSSNSERLTATFRNTKVGLDIPDKIFTFEGLGMSPGADIYDKRFLVWGQSFKGLRAALEFVPEREEYSFGRTVGLRYHIHNVTGKPIQFISETWRQDHGATVEDEQGNLQPVDYNWYSGWTPIERYYLKPGEQVVLERSAFGLAADSEQAEALGYPVGCTLVCKPGSYSVGFSVRLPAVRSSSLPPQAGDWQGVLQTGKRKLVVTAVSSQDQMSTADVGPIVSKLLAALQNEKYVGIRGGITRFVRENEDKELGSFLVEQLKSENRMRRCDAALCLELLGDRRGVPAIIKELNDTSYRPTDMIDSGGGQYQEGQVRQDHYYAAMLLGILGDKRAVPALIEATQDETINYQAAVSLGQIGDKRAVPVLRDMLDKNLNKPFQRVFTGYGLALLGDEEGLKVLIETLNNRQVQWSIRRHAIDLLGKLGDKQAVPHLIVALKDDHPNIRVSAARALGAIGDASALPALQEALKDNTETKVNAPTTVSKAAAEAIAQIEAGDGRKTDVPVEVEGTGEENQVVWGKAVQGVQVAAWVERMKWHIEGDMPRVEEIEKWRIGGDVPRVNVEVRVSDPKKFQESGLAEKAMAHDWSAFAVEIDGKRYKQNVFYTTEPGPLRSPFKIPLFLDDRWQGGPRLNPGRHKIRVLFVGLGMKVASEPVEIEVLPDDKKLEPWPYPWGKAVRGVQVSAHPVQPSWPVGSEPVIRVCLRNQGKEKWSIHEAPSSFALEVDGKRYENNFIFHVWRRSFAPGDVYQFDLKLSKSKPFHDGLRKGNTWPPVGKPPPLLPDKHTVRVLFTELRIEPEPASQPVEFEIVPAKEKPDVKVGTERPVIGGWEDVGNPIPADFNDTITLTEQITLGSIGRDVEGKSFITFVWENERKLDRQYRFILINNNDVVLEPDSHLILDGNARLEEKFTFDETYVPWRLKEFKFQSRPMPLAGTRSISSRLQKDTSAAFEGKTISPSKLAPPGRYAMELDGIDDYLLVPDSPTLRLEPPFIVEMWIKPKLPEQKPDRYEEWGLIAQGCYIGTGRVKPRGFGIELIRLEKEPAKFQINYTEANDGGLFGSPYGNYLFDEWMHISHVFNGDNYKPGPGHPLVVGRFLIPMPEPFMGQIGEIRIWNGARKREDIRRYRDLALTGKETGLVACWTFEQGEGQFAYDISGNNNHARLGKSIEPDDADPEWLDLQAAPHQPDREDDAPVEMEEVAEKVSQFIGADLPAIRSYSAL